MTRPGVIMYGRKVLESAAQSGADTRFDSPSATMRDSLERALLARPPPDKVLVAKSRVRHAVASAGLGSRATPQTSPSLPLTLSLTLQ